MINNMIIPNGVMQIIGEYYDVSSNLIEIVTDDITLLIITKYKHIYKIMELAIKKSYINPLKWLHNTYNITKNMIFDDVFTDGYSAFYLAINCNNLHIIEWMHNTYDVTYNDIIQIDVNSIFIANELSTVKWLHNTYNFTPDDIRKHDDCVLYESLMYCNFSTFIWLIETYNFEYNYLMMDDNNVLECVIYYGELEILQWLNNKFNLTDSNDKFGCEYIFENASINGHLHILEWLYDNYKFKIDDDKMITIFMDTFESNHLHILKWLYDKFNVVPHNNILHISTGKGNLDMLKWLHDTFVKTNYIINVNYDIIAKIAERLHYNDIIEWLHEINCYPTFHNKMTKNQLNICIYGKHIPK